MKRWNEKYHDKFKKHSLINQVWDMENLRKSWEKVRANKGSAGIDRESIRQFETTLEQNLEEIQRLLREGKYQPQPVKRVNIPKPDGKMRPLGIPTVRDRVVQQALKNILEPIFEAIFLPCSHGYRPNTNAHQAIRKAEAYLEQGYHWVVDADIEGFFDHVEHEILLDIVNEKVSDGRVLKLIRAFLESGVIYDGSYEASIEGTPQGGVISPLLANIYLNHFDRRMGEEGFLLLRYADDLIIFCRTEWEAKRALEVAKIILRKELDLTLSEKKTQIIMARKKGVEFLGFWFNGRWRTPKETAKQKFKDKIRHGTRRNQPRNLSMVIGKINPIISGWGRYFGDGTVKKLFEELDGWIRARLRSFSAKMRTNKVIWFTLPYTDLNKMGLISLTSLMTCSLQWGKHQTRAAYGKSVRAVR